MEESQNKSETPKAGINDFLANERTFLAWIRTSIALMAFGFVIVRFSLFLRQLSLVLGEKHFTPSKWYSAIVGVTMVALGCLLALFAFARYKSIERSLKTKGTIASSWLTTLITISVIIASILLMVFLLPSINQVQNQ